MFQFSRTDVKREANNIVNDVTIIALQGRLDALTALDFRPTIDELVRERRGKVVLNAAQLMLIDSSGVGAIVSLFKRLRVLGGDVKIAQLNGQPREIFRLLRLDRVFDLYDSDDAACGSFSK